jgi:hypothetical protein
MKDIVSSLHDENLIWNPLSQLIESKREEKNTFIIFFFWVRISYEND